MSRLSDVLGGVYRDDDPTPDQHDAAALDVAPEVDDAAPAPVWELDDDEPSATAESRPSSDPTDDAPVWDLQSVVDDPDTDWEPDEVFEVESEWSDPPQIADHENGSGSSWLEDLGDDASADSSWDLDTFEDLGADAGTDPVGFDVEDAVDEVGPEPTSEAAAVDDDDEGPTDAEFDRGRSAQSVAAASFGLLSAEEAPESDLDITDTGPWLRSDDDILPARSKRGIAFWRR